MIEESKGPCEVCIIKGICSSKRDCPIKNNFDRYQTQKWMDKYELNRIRSQSAVDGYFKRFGRSR